jgi:excisionase family DNA binding protein
VDQLAGLVSKLLDRETMKEWYTVKEAAELTGFKEYTLRQCCNLGRIREEWRQKDRGERWRIHRDAVEDIRNNGLPESVKQKAR